MNRVRIGLVLTSILFSSPAFSGPKFKGIDGCVLKFTDANFTRGYLNLKSIDELIIYKTYIDFIFADNRARILMDDDELKQSILEEYLRCVE